MEKRKNSLSALQICRFCLGQDETLASIYDRNKKSKSGIPLPLKILSCLSVEVYPSDKMPTFICQRCRFFMELFHDYKELCRNADERIMQYIHNGTNVETLNWPNRLLKVYGPATKKRSVMKTVTEGGATVQVTSQDISDSEDEDAENVYNIKIGDSPEGKCIKVVTANKNDDKEKCRSPKDSEANERCVRMRTSREDVVWACEQCDCTYPLKQLLYLHRRRKHRARTVACNLCHAKFFTKFDLMVHQVRHSDETPFQCVVCDKKFKRLVLLKRHEKQVHSDVPQLSCANCKATFLSLEDLQVHQRRHVRNIERTQLCSICNKRFLNRNTLRRHMETVHPKKPAFPCEYCPSQFSSVTKLTRHLRTHAGGRLFPCKYCDKSFLRSHHHTRHVRLSHREELRSSRAAGQPDQFRCEQCDQCFQSQDELIYHSAIHATQNLTCPLCQEKFDDVDAVTAHIKSHVNGIEFMCDLCELVFTSKEKLDTHLTLAHAEELENEESMEDIDAEEEDDDTGINLKEVDGQMVVEIKKAGGFMLPETPVNQEEKPDNTTASEESGEEATYTELSTVDTLAIVRKEAAAKEELELAAAAPATPALEATITPILTPAAAKPQETAESIRDSQTASILRKAEEVKRKVQQIGVSPSRELGEKKEKIARVESSNLGASDKTLRLLEKELQELKRTNSRNEASKAPIRNTETIRNRRPQLHTSTPKTRAESEKKFLASAKSMSFEKKALERKVVTKENKEPKEVKEVKNSTPVREEKEKKEEKETPKSGIKNGANDKNTSEENVRRSTRPSKIKDYAKMIRDKSQDSDEDSDNDDEEYREIEKPEAKGKSRRSSLKPASKPAPAPAPAAPAPAPAPRKRGRPRKDAAKDVPAKIMKEETVEDEQENDNEEVEKNTTTVTRKSAQAVEKEKDSENVESPLPTPAGNDANQSPSSGQKTPPAGGVLMSPSGQTLKKVPIRALPPGIKPLPLPVNARPMGAGELCEMQIGKKVVKVQKIVMTKAEVEAMAKKGLVEMKDGTMVLKQGIKIPTSDALSLKSSLVGDKEASKESPSKTDKPSIAQSNTSE